MPESQAVHHLMIDDVNMEKRRRVSPHDNIVRGHAREGDFSNVSLVLNSFQALQQLKVAEDAGTIGLADELSVIAIGSNTKTDYAISLMAALATKKKGSKAEDLAHTVTICLSEWERRAEGSRGPITTLQHDGASIMNQTVFPYVTTFEIDKVSHIGQIIFGAAGTGCPLFYTNCGNSPSRPIVDGIDPKHVLKRYRMALKRPEGVKIKDVTFTKRMLTKLLIEAGIATVTQVANLWGEGEEADAQNVDAAMKLVLTIASFREKSVKDFPQSGQTPAFTSIFKELVLLAEYNGLWFEVIGQQSSRTMRSGYIPLAEVTAAAVDLSHLAFILYRHKRA